MGSQRVASALLRIPWGSSEIDPEPGPESTSGINGVAQDLEALLNYFDLEAGVDYAMDSLLKTVPIEEKMTEDEYLDLREDCPSGSGEARCYCEISSYWALNLGDADCDTLRVMYWYHPDYLGNTEYITNLDGSVHQYFWHSPFGEPLIEQYNPVASYNSPFRFNGKELDFESGAYYYGARYYDPKVSNWLSVDPMAHFRSWLSPYQFVQNNPVNLVDPTGMLDGEPTGPGGGEGECGPGCEPSTNTSSEEGEGLGGKPHLFDGNELWQMTNEVLRMAEQQSDAVRNNEEQGEEAALDPVFLADILRHVPSFGIGNSNPFYGAEAIYTDAGWSFVGAEGDAGVFFILAGKDKGNFVSFTEIAGGVASDAGLGFEIGRVDVTGNPDKFTSEYLYGDRGKVWGAVSPTGQVISIGGGYSWGTAFGQRVTAKSLQFGFGASPIPFILGGGYNHGKINK